MRIDNVWREAFAPDSGTLLEIRVYGTSEADYRMLLSFLDSNFSIRYFRNGIESEKVPDYDRILKDYESVSAFVAIDVGVLVNLWFYSADEINLDLLPDDVDSVTKAERIINFMQVISTLLNKRVLLTAENASADQEWSEQHCIVSIAPPPDGSVQYHPEGGGWSRY